MIEQIIDHPNLGFRTLVVIYLKSILAIFQKNHLHASETGKIWKQTKVVKLPTLNFVRFDNWLIDWFFRFLKRGKQR